MLDGIDPLTVGAAEVLIGKALDAMGPRPEDLEFLQKQEQLMSWAQNLSFQGQERVDWLIDSCNRGGSFRSLVPSRRARHSSVA